MRKALLLLGLVVACGDDKDPALGALQTKVISGRTQTLVAGSGEPEEATNLSFRPILSVAQTPKWQRALLPKLLHAQTSSVNIQVQPGAIACVSENQTILVPKTRCVTADAFGQSRFDFIETHVAGTHKALLNSTYGLEATTFDTVTIIILPDVADPNFSPVTGPLQLSPAVIPVNAVKDRWGNAVPFRVVGDTVLTVGSDVVGTEGARTLTFSKSTSGDVVTELRGTNNALVGWLRYRIGQSVKQLTWESTGSASKP